MKKYAILLLIGGVLFAVINTAYFYEPLNNYLFIPTISFFKNNWGLILFIIFLMVCVCIYLIVYRSNKYWSIEEDLITAKDTIRELDIELEDERRTNKLLRQANEDVQEDKNKMQFIIDELTKKLNAKVIEADAANKLKSNFASQIRTIKQELDIANQKLNDFKYKVAS